MTDRSEQIKKMKDIDLIQMLGNLSRSLQSVAHLVGGVSYLTGIFFIYIGLLKFKKMAMTKSGSSRETNATPIAYIVGGAALLFLPTTLSVVGNSTFGNSNVLQYTNYNPYDVLQSVIILINTVGLIWFVRGCILMVDASRPGHQAGAKGFFYLVAGVFALNFKLTLTFVNYFVENLVNISLTVKSVVGY